MRWRIQEGDRVLTEAEWALFSTGLDILWNAIEEDISIETDDTDTGVAVFDRLTSEQKLVLLADAAHALHDPAIPTPSHTAVNEGAIMAVFSVLQVELEVELDIACTTDQTFTNIRPLLRAACEGTEDREEPLPDLKNTDPESWECLMEEVKGGIFWDYDFDMGDEFLDLPPEDARTKLQAFCIDPDYYLAVPDEPSKAGLTAARQTLARLLGLPIPDDDGLYLAIEDLYHDLIIGPCSPNEIAVWKDNPWVESIRMCEPGWDCDYPTWLENFSGVVPQAPFQFQPMTSRDIHGLPDSIRVECHGDSWVVKNDVGLYWCGLIENGWAGAGDDDMPTLSFPSEAEARAAFAQAAQLYDERAARHTAALARLGISE